MDQWLKNKAFLKEVDLERIKTLTARVTVLSWDERPLYDFTGKVLPGGSVNIDGNSSLRRTCNISLLLEDEDMDITNVQNIISINKKVKLEIGVHHSVIGYSMYPTTVWFPLGIYVIIQPNISRSLSGTTLSLQLKDKMCLLNGEMGGTLPASITFSEMGYTDDEGNEVIENPTIFQIILELVNHWGGEQLGNIIISDLDEKIKKVIKWNNPNQPVYIGLKSYNEVIEYDYQMGSSFIDDGYTKKSYGEDIGFVYTDFIWPDGDLIGDVGNSICDILDKIISILGNYEYFYDLDGHFIFQEKKNYLNTTQATRFLKELQKYGDDYLDYTKNSDYQIDMSKGKAEYVLDDNFLISSYTNTPQFNMIKNDFLVWGMRKTADGTTLPIRYHLAIDQKPELNSHLVVLYKDKDGFKKASKVTFIEEGFTDFKLGHFYALHHDAKVVGDNFIYPFQYQATTHNVFVEDDDKRVYVDLENLIVSQEYKDYIINSQAAGSDTNKKLNTQPYLKIYTNDSDLTFPVYIGYGMKGLVMYYENEIFKYEYVESTDAGDSNIKKRKELRKCGNDVQLVMIYPNNWRTELYLQGVEAEDLATDRNYYYTELVNEWPKLYDIEAGHYLPEVLEDPTSIDYFLDFIDADSAIGEFNIQNIGRRTKAEVDDKINCIFSIDPFDCVLIEEKGYLLGDPDVQEMLSLGQSYVLAEDSIIRNSIQGGTQNSAFAKIREMLYQYTKYCENISIQCIPIYHLDVNTRITVEDPKSNIFGDYMINRITLPLDCSGQMNITASRALDRI